MGNKYITRKSTQPQRLYNADDFRKEFKVGDLVQGFTKNMVVKITAIGQQRFLYIDPEDENSEFKWRERVAFIGHQSAVWRKPDENVLRELEKKKRLKDDQSPKAIPEIKQGYVFP